MKDISDYNTYTVDRTWCNVKCVCLCMCVLFGSHTGPYYPSPTITIPSGATLFRSTTTMFLCFLFFRSIPFRVCARPRSSLLGIRHAHNTHARTHARRGFGFITFGDPASVDKVLAQSLHELDGKKVCTCPHHTPYSTNCIIYTIV